MIHGKYKYISHNSQNIEECNAELFIIVGFMSLEILILIYAHMLHDHQMCL